MDTPTDTPDTRMECPEDDDDKWDAATPSSSTCVSSKSKRNVFARWCSNGEDSRSSHEKDYSNEKVIKRARKQIKAGKYDDAIAELTAGLGKAKDAALEHAYFSARSEAYMRLSRELLSRPASESEARGVLGLDPSHYAALALKDAQAAAAGGTSAHTCQLQGAALLLLEQYAAAKEAFLTGLFHDPACAELASGLRDAEAALQQAAAPVAQRRPRSASALEAGDDLECILCLKLLYEPATTPCGHTFCQPCFARSADHGNKCPLCRTVLHVGRELPVTITLKNVLERSFPAEYAARREEEASVPLCTDEAPLPLFVMATLLPGEQMALQIFEPRYRLMVRRCMAGSRRFGMVTHNGGGSGGELAGVACECEIVECRALPDGRFFLEVVGRRRCQLQRTWEQDGYRIAQPRYFSDSPPAGAPAGEGESAAALEELVGRVDAAADKWVDHLKAIARNRQVYQVLELLRRAGDKPARRDAEALSFWAACLIPLDQGPRLQLLSTQDTCVRLRAVLHALEQACEGGLVGGCTVM